MFPAHFPAACSTPRFQYLDPIIAATWADEGAVSDVCKALAPRFREPNAIVRFISTALLSLGNDVIPDCVQGSHRPPHHDAQRLH